MIDLLLAATERAEDVQQALGAQLTSLGLTFDQFDEDVAQLLSYLWHMKALAERHEDDADNHGENGSRSA